MDVRKLSYLFRTLRRVFKRYRLQFLVLGFLGILSGFLESFGLTAVIPLFFLITNQQPPELNLITQIIEFIFRFLHIPLTPPFLLTFIVGLFTLKGFIQFLARYINARTVAQFEEKTRRDVLRKTLSADWPYFLQQKLGHLENILIYDIERASTVFSLLANLILIITSLLMYLVAAFSISAPITLLTVFIGATIFLLFKPIFYRIRKMFSEFSSQQKGLSHHITEHLLGAKVIKAMSLESSVLKKAGEYFMHFRNIRTQAALYRQSTIALFEPLGFILITILFIFSYKSPTFNIAAFTIVIYFIQKIFSFVQTIQTQAQMINENTPYLRSIISFRQKTREHEEKNTGTKKFVFNDTLQFRDVSFQYPNSNYAMQSVTFAIPKGQTVGIIGPSGSGKTTLADLLLRLLKPTAGTITMDGIPIEEISLKDWRRHIGYMPQDLFLLNDTVENNIRFYDEKVSQAEIESAAKLANIYDTIQELPQGFQTVVGERGIQLSGGQRQRIVLARALARKPKILILDEATSSIDAESEALIQKALAKFHGSITTIIIAHRLSTIMNADKLIVLDRGEIIEQGSPQELLENKSSYLHRAYAANAH